MTKIIKSLSLIAFVAAVAVIGTSAYFTDTETSTNNIMQAGSLDLILNDVNGDPVLALVEIEDMKPCQIRYSAPIKLHITNNPGRIYKKISIPADACETVTTTEPECTEENGTWNISNQECDGAAGSGTDYSIYNDLFPVTWFDLAIWEGIAPPVSQDIDGTDLICNGTVLTECWRTIIPDNEVTVSNIANSQIYLGGEDGAYDVGSTIVIRQSFHMDKDAGNEFQTDKCTFGEEFMVRQENAGHPADVYNADGETGDADCADREDNDYDNLVDCEDPGCAGYGGCPTT